MGFGFVEYKKPESAQKALRQLQVSLSLSLSPTPALGEPEPGAEPSLGRAWQLHMELGMSELGVAQSKMGQHFEGRGEIL